MHVRDVEYLFFILLLGGDRRTGHLRGQPDPNVGHRLAVDAVLHLIGPLKFGAGIKLDHLCTTPNSLFDQWPIL